MPNTTPDMINSYVNGLRSIEYTESNYLVDGTSVKLSLPPFPTSETSAYVHGTRESKVFQDFPCFDDTRGDYYPGSIVRLDKSFKTTRPNFLRINFEAKKSVRFNCPNLYLGDNLSAVPTAANFSSMKQKALDKFRTSGRSVSNTQKIEIQSSSSEQGVSIGGKIKGVEFGLSSGKQNRNVTVITLKQTLFSLELDNVYSKASDFFTSDLDLQDLKRQNGNSSYALGVISKVDYGRVLYICISTVDSSAANASLAGASLNLGGVSKSREVKAYLFGGTCGKYNVGEVIDEEADIKKLITAIYNDNDITTCAPISYSVAYLQNPMINAKMTVNKYFQQKVDFIKIRIIDENKGVSFSGCWFHHLEPVLKNGRLDYCFMEDKPTPTATREIGPRSICMEIKVDAQGGSQYDYNIFIPYIPLDQLSLANDGFWYFYVYLYGSCLWDTKGSFGVYPSVPWTCWSDNANVYMNSSNYNGILKDSTKYKGKSENEVFDNYMQWIKDVTMLKDKPIHHSTSWNNKLRR